ncbi:MAG: endonuclease/exonuclease/phosphatase family protein [Verrucomicrobia bacterium]|nr:endonuclease/exonuclease/phosphatase family protein [Verrucomicrobiota bacterium]MBI3868508.1 endonuclease/exonuclease/phosphatase family protein [Verrucomicrobiota bacterium]
MGFARVLILLAGAFIALDACCAEPAKGGAEFKMAAWNVFFRNTNVAEVVEIVKEMRPDILALEETTPRIERELRRDLSDLLPHQHFRTELGSGGCGVMSRWPLSRIQYLSPTGGFRGALIGAASWAGNPGGSNEVEFAVVHLATPRVGRMKSLTSALAVFQQSGEAQSEEILRVHSAMRRVGPAVILGDFNSFSFSSAQTFLKQELWIDSLLSADPDADRRITWKGSEATRNIGGRIDYLFHNQRLRTLESGVIAKGSSDHFPVWSRLQVLPASDR